MLKIKDDVDLKILKEYGFDLKASSIEGIGTFDFTDNYIDDNFGWLIAADLEICDRTREIIGDNLSLFYKLVKDGLVEEVEEDVSN